ncbi:hypothetical protein BGX29_011152 [Mortierella sp. GBA35]|nr:hypothetical protein BGX29_011152 [Mortierella sp. GBA35]
MSGPAEPQLWPEVTRTQLDQTHLVPNHIPFSGSPSASRSSEEAPMGQRSQDGYDNYSYSATTTPESRSQLWFSAGENNGEDVHISEDVRAKSPSFEPSRQQENGHRNRHPVPAFDDHTGPITHGPDACVIEERGIITFIEQYDDGFISEPWSLEAVGPDDPLLLVHTRRYMDSVTVNDHLIHIRLVMTAGQLPRGDAFARMSGRLRARHLVDIFLIPHESKPVPADHDVVLGISGTLDRICQVLKDLLWQLVHGTDGFVLWRLHLLIPIDITHLVVEGHRKTNSETRFGSFRCSLPRLKNAKGRVYDPISDTDESILSIQSCSLEVILDAVRCLGEVLAKEEDAQIMCEEFYTGGRSSVIPVERKFPKQLFHSTTKLDRMLPLGYVLRPEMKECLRAMRVNRYHIQLLMQADHASFIAGDAGNFVRTLCENAGASISFSDKSSADDLPIRFCDIGSHDHKALETAVVQITRWMYEMSCGDWSVKVVIPERVAVSCRTLTWRGFKHEVVSLSKWYRPSTADAFELEPAEEESVLRIESLSQVRANGILIAVQAVLSAIYTRGD